MGQSRKRRRTAGAGERSVVDKLQDVRPARRRFQKLSQQITEKACDELVPPSGLVVEVGAGDGQFRAMLPENILSRLISTEPLALGTKKLQAAYPDADIRRASIEKLPFPDGELAAVVGLCVFDVLKDGPAAAKECARVLKPGGVVLHLLDMSVDTYWPLLQLQAAKLVALPNVFSDPCEQTFPDDMFVVPAAQLARIVQILERVRSPLAKGLRSYLAVYQGVPFSAARASVQYDALAEDGQAKLALRELLSSVNAAATPAEREELARYQGHCISSVKHLDGRLRTWFSAEAGFEVLVANMVAGSMLASREDPARSYHSIAAGHVRGLAELPSFLLAADELERAPQAGEQLLEQSVYVFAARRV